MVKSHNWNDDFSQEVVSPQRNFQATKFPATSDNRICMGYYKSHKNGHGLKIFARVSIIEFPLKIYAYIPVHEHPLCSCIDPGWWVQTTLLCCWWSMLLASNSNLPI